MGETVQKRLQDYRDLVRDIHFAQESGDESARRGLAGMLEKKAKLEKELMLTPEDQDRIFEDATQGSPYRQ